MSHLFPSLEWMSAYADAVAAHDRAADVAAGLAGRYRFVITPGGPLDQRLAYDLLVEEGPGFSAHEGEEGAASLTVATDYPRWRGLLTGESDFVMSFLMRRIKVDGDIGAIRSRLRDARPLLDCLRQVPTTFL